jgi:N-acyl-D-amino-acid deacylase
MNPRSLRVFGLLGLLAVQGVSAQDRTVLIRNGRVLDGSGNPWVRADVLVRGARIEAIGDLAGRQAD